MRINVQFHSYFKDAMGCAETSIEIEETANIANLFESLSARFPKWASLRKCALVAVGVDYQPQDYVLKPGDEVSLFPPVQGG